MSLYLGTSPKGGVLHISSDYKSQTELAGDPIETTVFHSSLPYLDLVVSQEIPITGRKASRGFSWRGYGTAYMGLFTAEIPESLFQYFTDDYLVLVEVKSRNSNYEPFLVRSIATAIYDSSYYNNYSTYSSGANVFTDSPDVPKGGGYYSNNYANFFKIKTAPYPSTAFKHLMLAFAQRSSSLADNIYLQGEGGAGTIDVVDSVGKIYVFNMTASKLNPAFIDGLSVQLDSNNFVITGDNKQTDLSTYAFVTSGGSSGDVSFQKIGGKSTVGSFDLFNKDRIPATGWNIDFSSSNFSINKLSNEGTTSLINPSISYVKLSETISVPLDLAHSGNYTLTDLINYNGGYKFFIAFIAFSATMNGKTVQISSHYHIGFAENTTSETFTTARVGVTNYQLGKTHRIASFLADNSLDSIALQYKSTLSGNSYPISTSLSGSLTLLVFN